MISRVKHLTSSSISHESGIKENFYLIKKKTQIRIRIRIKIYSSIGRIEGYVRCSLITFLDDLDNIFYFFFLNNL